MATQKITAVFIAVMIMTTALLFAVITPYYGAVLWAIILAILFYPLYQRLLHATGRRANLSAILTVLICICLVVIPTILLVGMLAREAASAYQQLSSQDFNLAAQLDQLHKMLPQSVLNILDRLDLPSMADIAQRFSSFLQSMLQVVAKGFYSFSQSAIGFTIAFGVALYLLFFFFRDGRKTASLLREASPLTGDQTDRLMRTFSSVVSATVRGNVIIAAVQGGIGGVTFWLLGIPGALLWGVVMAVLSLIPAIGAGLIWFPAAMYLLLTGNVAAGIILLVVGFGIISMVDNLLRPRLVGSEINMPDYLVLLSTLGGLSVFGINGFVLGPLFAALFLTTWRLYIEARGPRND